MSGIDDRVGLSAQRANKHVHVSDRVACRCLYSAVREHEMISVTLFQYGEGGGTVANTDIKNIHIKDGRNDIITTS